MNDALKIKNTDIAKELSLPPVKLHCSMLAEDAIKAALKDYQIKQSSRNKVEAEERAARAQWVIGIKWHLSWAEKGKLWWCKVTLNPSVNSMNCRARTKKVLPTSLSVCCGTDPCVLITHRTEYIIVSVCFLVQKNIFTQMRFLNFLMG